MKTIEEMTQEERERLLIRKREGARAVKEILELHEEISRLIGDRLEALSSVGGYVDEFPEITAAIGSHVVQLSREGKTDKLNELIKTKQVSLGDLADKKSAKEVRDRINLTFGGVKK